MSVLTGLLERIRGKRQERFTSTAEAYDDCVHKLASGQEVDLDHLAGLLDELDKSDADLEADIENKQRRIAARSELDRLTELSKTLPAKKQTVAKLQQELADFVSKKRPAIEALNAEIKMLQLECDRSSYVENELMSVGIPMALVGRIANLDERQKFLGAKSLRYEEGTSDTKRLRDALQVRIESVDHELKKTTVAHVEHKLRRDREEHQRRLDNATKNLEAWQPLADEIEAERQAIALERAEIRKSLMTA